MKRSQRFSQHRLSPQRVIQRFVMLVALVSLALLSIPGGSGSAAAAIDSATVPTGAAAPSAIPAVRAATNLAIITIEGEINAVTAHSVKRRIQQAVDGGADGIVFDIDSPGGEVGAVLEICTQIKQCPIANTIGWVNPQAYSGGAFAALACREIVLAPHATMGDAAPVAGDPINFAQGLRDTERQKILAPLLTEIVDSARLRGYDEKLVQGFVTLGVELWVIRDRATGKKYFVDEAEYRTIFGEEPPRGSPHIASGAASRSGAAPGAPATGNAPATEGGETEAEEEPIAVDSTRKRSDPSEDPTAFRPATDTIHHNTITSIELGLTTASTRPLFTSADRGSYELVEYATDGKTLLTMKEADLKRYGFADAGVTIRTDEELKQYVGAQHVRRLDQSWSENFVAFMTQGFSGLVVRGLLIVIFLMAMFIEMSMPGVGLPGGIALVALAGLIVPPMLIGAAAWWAAALILGGVVMILMELFIFPGFGLPGIMGLLMLLAGLVGTFADVGQLFPGTGPGRGGDLAWALSIVLLAVFVAGVGIYFFTRYADKFPVAGKLVLANTPSAVSAEENYSMLAAMGPAPVDERLSVRLGEIGRARTSLRPSGTAEFGDKFVDVVAAYGFIDAGQTVRVTDVTEYRIAVEPVRDDEMNETTPGSEPKEGGRSDA